MKIYQKMVLLIIWMCFRLSAETMAQNAKFDVIVKWDNTKISAVIQEMDENIIKYKKIENPSGPVYTISKSEVLSVLYRNGEVENFANVKNPTGQNQTPKIVKPEKESASEMISPPPLARNHFEKQIQQMRSEELRMEYKRYKAKATHGLVTGIVFTSLGVVAIGVGAALLSDPYYYESYGYDYDEDKQMGGIAAVVTGVAFAGGLGTIGWIKMARNRSKAKIISSELSRRKEPFISFKLRPGYNLSNHTGYLSLTARF